jgi:signal transduction histidine kinase
LQSLLRNLLSNSLKYKDPDRPLTIRVSTKVNRAQGKGIGLYLVKSMVENNGGSVTVESTPGKGTSFTFTLIPYE